MPVYDFGSVDENTLSSFIIGAMILSSIMFLKAACQATHTIPIAVSFELQDAIAAYHQADMSVIMDVVYNHVYERQMPMLLKKIVPGYFYRLDEQGLRTNGTFWK